LCVVINFAAQPAAIPMPEGTWELLLSSVPEDAIAGPVSEYATRIFRRKS
jgi:hypothetical protein